MNQAYDRDNAMENRAARQAEAGESADWLAPLAEEAARPMEDGDAFTQRVLGAWEQPSAKAGDAEPAGSPMNISRGWELAAAITLAVWIGWLAAQTTPPAAEHAGPTQAGMVAEETEGDEPDPVGVLVREMSRQMSERPEQVRRAIEGATILLGGGDWEEAGREPGTSRDDRRS